MPYNDRSKTITQGIERSPNRAMFYGLGYTKEDFDNPMIGVANGHSTITPCNGGLQALADVAVSALKGAGANPQMFGVPTISDGMAMGTEGMKYSLISREVIADCIEMTVQGQWMDGVLVIGGCDKNKPGGMIGIARANVPAIYVYGGTIRPGRWKGVDLSIISAFEAVGAVKAGRMSMEDMEGIERNACPTTGACGGMYTANTMSSSFEALGMALFYSSTMANTSEEKLISTKLSAETLVEAVKAGIRPRDIITRASIENAVALIMATGGSSNAVLHYLAIARAAEVEWVLDDFERVRRRVPVICNLKPSGKYMAVDLHGVGGVPQVLKMLLNAGLIDGDCMTITGRTLGEELAKISDSPPRNQDIIYPVDAPIYAEGHLAVLKGNLAPNGAIAKVTGLKSTSITGPARVFEDEQTALDAILSDQIKPGDVMVLRYLGPRGGPGMPEMLAPTSAIVGRGLGDKVGLITDGRFSGGSWGMLVGHVTPEAFEGGTIALVHEGDSITIDAGQNLLALNVAEEELAIRRAAWTQPAPRYTTGVLGKFARLARPANEGAGT